MGSPTLRLLLPYVALKVTCTVFDASSLISDIVPPARIVHVKSVAASALVASNRVSSAVIASAAKQREAIPKRLLRRFAPRNDEVCCCPTPNCSHLVLVFIVAPFRLLRSPLRGFLAMTGFFLLYPSLSFFILIHPFPFTFYSKYILYWYRSCQP